MKILRIMLLVALLGITACGKKEETTVTEETTTTEPAKAVQAPASADEQEIQSLVLGMYQWEEGRDHNHGFEPVIKGGMIVGYNMDNHKLLLDDLRSSGFFAEAFITNMDGIVKAQDKLLREGKAVWANGDMPPFGNGTDPWCSCQDYPTDHLYDKINFVLGKTDGDSAELYWNWEGFGKEWADHHYALTVVKENGKWKIESMSGWEYSLHTTVN